MLDADWSRGPSQILWPGRSRYKEENWHPFKVNELCCAALLGLVPVIEGSPLLSIFDSLRECEKHLSRSNTSTSCIHTHTYIYIHVVFIFSLNMQSVSSQRASLIPLFLSFCSFVFYYEGVLIHLCELASCTFNARYLLCVVRFTLEKERGSRSKVFSMELPLKSYSV